jgi:hypothetical protein
MDEMTPLYLLDVENDPLSAVILLPHSEEVTG